MQARQVMPFEEPQFKQDEGALEAQVQGASRFGSARSGRRHEWNAGKAGDQGAGARKELAAGFHGLVLVHDKNSPVLSNADGLTIPAPRRFGPGHE